MLRAGRRGTRADALKQRGAVGDWCARPHAGRGRQAVGAVAAVGTNGGVVTVPGLELLFGDDAAEADELDAIVRNVEETAGILTAGNASLEDKTLPFEDQDGLNGHLDPGCRDQHELIVLLDGQLLQQGDPGRALHESLFSWRF